MKCMHTQKNYYEKIVESLSEQNHTSGNSILQITSNYKKCIL